MKYFLVYMNFLSVCRKFIAIIDSGLFEYPSSLNSSTVANVKRLRLSYKTAIYF